MCVGVCGCVCVQMYVNALIKRAGIFAGQQNMDKCKTCLEKALAVCPDSIDVLVHRARVSLFQLWHCCIESDLSMMTTVDRWQ